MVIALLIACDAGVLESGTPSRRIHRRHLLLSNQYPPSTLQPSRRSPQSSLAENVPPAEEGNWPSILPRGQHFERGGSSAPRSHVTNVQSGIRSLGRRQD